MSAELERLGLSHRVERVAAVETTDGERGCRDSHVACVRRAMADGVEVALILEDDVCFVDDPRPPLRRALDELRAVGAWDAFYLGAQTLEPPAERLRDLFRGRVLQTHAVALHRRAFGRALHATVPVDRSYALTLVSWIAHPPIATQLDDRSDIAHGIAKRAEAMRRSLWLHTEASPLQRWLGALYYGARRRLGLAVVAWAARAGVPLRFEGFRPRLGEHARRRPDRR